MTRSVQVTLDLVQPEGLDDLSVSALQLTGREGVAVPILNGPVSAGRDHDTDHFSLFLGDDIKAEKGDTFLRDHIVYLWTYILGDGDVVALFLGDDLAVLGGDIDGALHFFGHVLGDIDSDGLALVSPSDASRNLLLDQGSHASGHLKSTFVSRNLVSQSY